MLTTHFVSSSNYICWSLQYNTVVYIYGAVSPVLSLFVCLLVSRPAPDRNDLRFGQPADLFDVQIISFNVVRGSLDRSKFLLAFSLSLSLSYAVHLDISIAV